MAFDNFLLRGDLNTATPPGGEETNEASWTRTRALADVEDNSTGRTLRFPSTAPSLTLWDEVAPAPRAMRDEPGDGPED